MASMKQLPYGVSDFKQLRREDKYIVDKTRYIHELEDVGNFLFLIRPRRFGKSVFLSMLRSYYDILERDKFQELFKGLWIADHVDCRPPHERAGAVSGDVFRLLTHWRQLLRLREEL